MIFLGGLLFGIGLALSGLTRQEVVLGFLRLDDLGMALTMAAALLVTMPVYRLCRGDRFPRVVQPKHVVGGAIFGIGWGLSGVCPGAALASLGTGNWPMLAGVAGMLIGAYLHGVWESRRAASAARRYANGFSSALRP